MKAIKCEVCGGNDLIKQSGLFVCQNCGTKYTPDEARGLFSGTVKIDYSEEIEALYTVARRAINDSNYESAEQFYAKVLEKDPHSWEATFYHIYCRAMHCRIGEIAIAGQSIANTIKTTIELIVSSPVSEEEKNNAIIGISNNCFFAERCLYNAAFSAFNDIDRQYRYEYVPDLSERCSAAISILTALGLAIESDILNEQTRQPMIEAWKRAIDDNQYLLNCISKQSYLYAKMIKKSESAYFTINMLNDKLRQYGY